MRQVVLTLAGSMLGATALAALSSEPADANSIVQYCGVHACPECYRAGNPQAEWLAKCGTKAKSAGTWTCYEEQGSVTSDQGYGPYKSARHGHLVQASYAGTTANIDIVAVGARYFLFLSQAVLHAVVAEDPRNGFPCTKEV